MNKFLIYPLIIFFLVAVVHQFYLFSNGDLSGTFSSNSGAVNQNLIQNGSATSIQTSGVTMNFSLDFIAIIIGVVALGAVIGITALGSGLSERAQKIIFNSAVYYGIWGVLNALIVGVFLDMPLFGAFLLLCFSGVYTMGFLREINTHSGN